MNVEELVMQLPRPEKLRLMESLWVDLSQDADGLDSPGWHEAALRDTQRRIESGEEQVLNWDEAKQSLRKR